MCSWWISFLTLLLLEKRGRKKKPEEFLWNIHILQFPASFSSLTRFHWHAKHTNFFFTIGCRFKKFEDDFLWLSLTFFLSLQFSDGIRLLSPKCLLNNRWIWVTSRSNIIFNGNSRSCLVFGRICPKVRHCSRRSFFFCCFRDNNKLLLLSQRKQCHSRKVCNMTA